MNEELRLKIARLKGWTERFGRMDNASRAGGGGGI